MQTDGETEKLILALSQVLAANAPKIINNVILYVFLNL
jgi:hypothetical protein